MSTTPGWFKFRKQLSMNLPQELQHWNKLLKEAACPKRVPSHFGLSQVKSTPHFQPKGRKESFRLT